MKKLLLVEDDDAVCRYLENRLKEYCEVISVKNPEDIMRLFENENPDGVLMDYELWGGLKGTQFLEIMRERRSEIPVMMMTGNHGMAPELGSLSDGCFLKPLDIEILKKRFIQIGLIQDKINGSAPENSRNK